MIYHWNVLNPALDLTIPNNMANQTTPHKDKRKTLWWRFLIFLTAFLFIGFIILGLNISKDNPYMTYRDCGEVQYKDRSESKGGGIYYYLTYASQTEGSRTLGVTPLTYKNSELGERVCFTRYTPFWDGFRIWVAIFIFASAIAHVILWAITIDD